RQIAGVRRGQVLYKDKPHAGIHWKRVKLLLESFQPTCRGTDANNWERRLARFFARLRRSFRRRQCGSRRFSFPTHVQCSTMLQSSASIQIFDRCKTFHHFSPTSCLLLAFSHISITMPADCPFCFFLPPLAMLPRGLTVIRVSAFDLLSKPTS